MLNQSTELAEALEGESFDFNEIDEESEGFLVWLTFCDEGGVDLAGYHDFLTDIMRSEHIYQFAVVTDAHGLGNAVAIRCEYEDDAAEFAKRAIIPDEEGVDPDPDAVRTGGG